MLDDDAERTLEVVLYNCSSTIINYIGTSYCIVLRFTLCFLSSSDGTIFKEIEQKLVSSYIAV